MNNINTQVKEGIITLVCFECAKKHRTEEPYSLVTARENYCQVCGELTQVASAQKLFGYYRMT